MPDQITATLANGDTLTFPAGTDPAVIDRVVKQHVTGQVQDDSGAQKPPVPNTAPDAPMGSPQAMTHAAFTRMFGRFAPQAEAGARAGLGAVPVANLGAQIVEEGAPAGGMAGGLFGGITGGYGGAVMGSAAGGAIADAASRWWRGEPQDAAGSAGAGGFQGALSAVAPGVGKLIGAAARPLYRGALKAGTKIVENFGDVARKGLEMGIPADPKSIPTVQRALTDSRNAALQMVTQAEARGAPPMASREMQDALDPVFQQARQSRAAGEAPPVGALIDRSQALIDSFARQGGSIRPTQMQVMKEDMQDAAGRAFDAINKVGGRESTLNDTARLATANAAKEYLERVVHNNTGLDLRSQNLNTKQLMGLLRALQRLEVNEQAGANQMAGIVPGAVVGTFAGPTAGMATGVATRAARSPEAMSRVAIGLDRAGRTIGGDRLAQTVRALHMLLSNQPPPPPQEIP